MYVCSVRAELQQCFVFRSSDKLIELSSPAEPPTHLGSATAESKEAKHRRFRASNRLGLLLEPVCPAFLALHALISELRMIS